MNNTNLKDIYAKRVIVDFDDTLALHNGQQFELALPNMPVIDKVNELYDLGFHIVICTARGSLSCDSREAARVKYESQITNWLTNNGVKFNELSFMKELGIMYVDDKAVTLDSFSNMPIVNLKGGYSGDNVQRVGDTVVKHDQRAKQTAAWMKSIRKLGLHTPDVTVIDQTLFMSFINGKTLTESLVAGDTYKIDDVVKIINTFANNETNKFIPRETYANRVQGHIDNMIRDRLASNANTHLADKICSILNECSPTVYHGDMSSDNIMVSDTGDLVLIDPIQLEDVWYSYILDAAKLVATISMYTDHSPMGTARYIYDNTKVSEEVEFFCDFSILVACELARMYKYRKTMIEKNLIYNLFLLFSHSH